MEKEPLPQSPEDSVVEEARRIVRSAKGYAVNKTVAHAKEELRDSSNPLFEIATLRDRFEAMLESDEWYTRASERIKREYKISPIDFKVRCGVVHSVIGDTLNALEKVIEKEGAEGNKISDEALNIIEVFRNLVFKNLGEQAFIKLKPVLDVLLDDYRASMKE